MELIAASRINKAREAVEAARPYAAGVSRVIRDLAAVHAVAEHPLLKPRDEIKRVAVIVISSDRGLAGAYNTNVLRRAERLAKEEQNAGREVEVYALGRKGEGYFKYRRSPSRRAGSASPTAPLRRRARGRAPIVMELRATATSTASGWPTPTSSRR